MARRQCPRPRVDCIVTIARRRNTVLGKLSVVGKPSDKVSVITLRAWGQHPFGPPDDDQRPVTLRTVARWLTTVTSHDPTFSTVHVWTLPNGVTVADASYYIAGCPNRFRVAFTDTFTPELRNN